MDERAIQLRVGYMVLGSLLIAGILIVLFGESPKFIQRLFQPTYQVHLWFPEGRGLTEEGLVRRNGIVVGRVGKIQFAADEADLARPEGVSEVEFYSGILVTAEIREDAKIFAHDICTIETDILGKPTLHFRRDKDKPAGTTLLDITKLHRGEIAPDPLDSLGTVTETLSQLAPDVDAATTAITDAGNALEEAAQQVTSLLNEDTQTQLRTALARANESLESIHNLVGDEETQAELRAAMKQLPESLNEMRTAMQKAQDRLDDVQAFTEKLGSPETIDRLDRSTRHLDQVMSDLSAFSANLKNPQGSLGMLLNDRELYDNLNTAVGNISDVTQQLEPILDDARIFTDKIARHPELLGDSGVLRQSTGIK